MPARRTYAGAFWCSVDLTGNQTFVAAAEIRIKFWCSVDLTGNQTAALGLHLFDGFGAVSI